VDYEWEVEMGDILSVAVFQAKRRIWREPLDTLLARSLAPLVKTRGFGMTP
jgi:hypothetical protein